MKAMQFKEHGKANVLNLETIPNPKVGEREVLVDIKAAGINHLDIWVRQGMPGVKIPLPRIPGSDAAGVVAACGPSVDGVKVGDSVIISPGMCANPNEVLPQGWDSLGESYHLLGLQVDGTYCEKIVVPARRVIVVSEAWSMEEWASVSLVFLTAWHMLHGHAKLQANDKVLVHAAGSGIGSAAIQMVKLAGAQVFTTVGDNAKASKAKALGADTIINYKEKDFSKEILSATDGKGVDVIFEHIGPETWQKNLLCLAKGGRLVTCGATSGPNVNLDLRFLFMKQQTIKGSYMGSHQELCEVIRLLNDKKLKPVLDKTFPLAEASAAHEYMESRKNFGKIVLNINS